MIHRNILVFILFIVLAPVLLWGQDVMWSTGMKENAKLLYDANGAGLAVNANQVIREIADDMIRPYEAVSIELRATLDVRVRKGKDGKPSLAVSFAQLGLSGDTHFRGFPIEESIKPDRVSFTCCITNKISHDSIITIEASELPWYTYDSRFLVRPIPRFSVDSDTIVVRDFRMALTDATLKRFQERVALINDYYAACAIFDTLQQGLRQLDFSLAGNFPRYFIFLEEMNKILAVIKDKDLEKKLDLQAFDPRDFRRRNAQITRQADEVTALFKDKIKATTIIIPYDSTEVLISEFLSGITRYIRWSMLVSERNSRMYYQYLRDYFTMNAFGKDGPVIRDLVARIWPKEKDNVVMTRISLKIKSSYNDLADQLIRDHRYAESVELLKHAKSFAKINPFLKENDSDKKMTSKAANGIYDSYLGIAEFAIENNKKAMARLYLQKAQLYLKEHAPYVTPDSLFNHVVGELITGNCAQCDTLYKHGQYSDAYNCYREFRSGNDTVTLALCLPNIDKRIGYCKKLMSPAALAAAAKEPAKPTPVASVLNVSGKPVLVAAAPKEPGKPQAGEKVERPLATRAMAAVPGKTQGRQHQDISKIVRMHEPQSLAVSSPVQGSLPSYLAKRVPGIGAKPVRMHEPLLLAVTEPVQGSLPSSMIRRVAVILSNPVRMQEPLSLLIPRPVPVSLPPFFTRPAPGKVVKPARMHEPRLLAVTKQVRDTLPPALTKRVHDSIQLAMTKPLPVIPVAKPVHPSLPQSVTKPQPVITENIEIAADTLSDSIAEDPIPHFLASLLSSGVSLIWTNQLKLADHLVDSIASAQNKHGLASSYELTHAISLYRKKIAVMKCWTEKENTEVFLLRAQEQREKKDFIRAAALQDSALMCIKKNPECDISPTGLEDTVKTYSEAVEYQKKLKEVQRLSVPRKERELVKSLCQAEQYFSVHHIARFGITNLATYDVVREKANTYLTMQAFNYFRQQQRFQDAFLYLKLLRIEDYPEDKVRDYQVSIAGRIADKDFKEHPDDNPSTRVLSYTNGDKYFKPFSESYRKTWKSRQKQHIVPGHTRSGK